MTVIYPEPIYDLRELAKCNLHVHTSFSGCAHPDALPQDIVREADRLGLDTIALTDHFNDLGHDERMLAQIDELKRAVDAIPHNVRVLYGFELSGYGVGRWLEKDSTLEKLDYRLYSCNHFHLKFWDHPEDRSPRGYAEFAMAIVRSVVEADRADCIAHPLVARFIPFDDKTLVTKAMKDEEIYDLSCVLRDHNTAWEINTKGVAGDPDFVRRLWNIGKEVGTTFHIGTDTHNIANIDTLADIDYIESVVY